MGWLLGLKSSEADLTLVRTWKEVGDIPTALEKKGLAGLVWWSSRRPHPRIAAASWHLPCWLQNPILLAAPSLCHLPGAAFQVFVALAKQSCVHYSMLASFFLQVPRTIIAAPLCFPQFTSLVVEDRIVAWDSGKGLRVCVKGCKVLLKITIWLDTSLSISLDFDIITPKLKGSWAIILLFVCLLLWRQIRSWLSTHSQPRSWDGTYSYPSSSWACWGAQIFALVIATRWSLNQILKDLPEATLRPNH